jgi:hypothetical protein
MPELLPRKNWATFRRSAGAFACCSNVDISVHCLERCTELFIPDNPVFLSRGTDVARESKWSQETLCAGAALHTTQPRFRVAVTAISKVSWQLYVRAPPRRHKF